MINRQKLIALSLIPAYFLGGCSSEKIETAAMNTLMGICTVFFILALISVLIYCFRIIPVLTEKFNKKDEPSTPHEPYVDKRLLTPEHPKPPAEKEDETELVAVIAAAIASETGLDPNAFVVRRIKRIK